MEIEKLKKWFKKRPVWLQEATKRTIEKGALKDVDYEELYEHCLNEAKNQTENSDIVIPIDQLLSPEKSNGIIRLQSIGSIKGIDALSPKEPLSFGDKNLTIIYGLNSSGKSGYVRILKHICGKKTHLPLISNIYKSAQQEQKCAIEYKKGDELKPKEWHVSEQTISDLTCVDIFDSECGVSYVRNENEAAYEPQILSFFSDLVKVCEKISAQIQSEIDKNPTKKPAVPPEYNATEAGKWYNENLSADTTEECLNKYCSWTEDNKKKLAELQKRLAQEDPNKKAEQIRQKNTHLRGLIDNTSNLLESLSDQKCMEINQLKTKCVEAKKTAKIAANQFKTASLEGVGSETWKQLWQYAKKYSEKEAYKGQLFPVISDDALCVLCHQKLDEDAKIRFKSFEEFIKGEAQKAVEKANKSLEVVIQNLPQILDQEALKTKLDAIGLQSDNKQIKDLYIELEKRKKQLISSDIQPNPIPLPSFEEWKEETEGIIEERERKAKQYDEDAEENNRENLLAQQKELQTREWLSQQVNAINEEINRLKDIEILKSAKKLTDTKEISTKKSQLSKKLITEGFINRFNTELRELRADRIQVEIAKTRTERGKVYHQIQLKNTKSQPVKAIDILSEGETRIVALSAFLADVMGGNPSTPFIFDDPIS
ncbi:MAG: hypothetical protein OXJ52_03190, partial [Oligoflexia bacterium]|nr:hypothetical protein [Oligoflexia bacterium]